MRVNCLCVYQLFVRSFVRKPSPRRRAQSRGLVTTIWACSRVVRPPDPHTAWPGTSMATLVVLAALHIGAHHVTAAETFKLPAVGAMLRCADPDQRHTSHGPATAWCFDAHFVNPHAGLSRGTAESANAARAVAWRKLFRGSYLHRVRSAYVDREQLFSTDCARARFDPASGTLSASYQLTSPSTLRHPQPARAPSSPSLPR